MCLYGSYQMLSICYYVVYIDQDLFSKTFVNQVAASFIFSHSECGCHGEHLEQNEAVFHFLEFRHFASWHIVTWTGDKGDV